MKKLFFLWTAVTLLTACHINTPEPPKTDDTKSYEAYGLLTIPSSGFTKENVRTMFVLKENNELDLYMFDVKFANAMPVTIDMLIRGVGYANEGGEIVFYGDSIIPTAGGKPYEKYIVTDLQGIITADSVFITNNYGTTPSVYAGKLKDEF